ncbi:MAG: hypothetical protein CVV41_13025 [Candidatus Riflebacteria bacterium HGW-Riflebacteria-1]|nr:MAG: hypothetical protein CVV41_13025 [Candidatus Riflebacteria bacterium HGW-Riflebacteria-1]
MSRIANAQEALAVHGWRSVKEKKTVAYFACAHPQPTSSVAKDFRSNSEQIDDFKDKSVISSPKTQKTPSISL